MHAAQRSFDSSQWLSSSEVEETCRRAHELCQQVTDRPELFGALAGLKSVYFNRRQPRIAIELAHEMLLLAERLDRRSFRLWANYAMGFALTGPRRLGACTRTP
jgi:hypothetical protein